MLSGMATPTSCQKRSSARVQRHRQAFERLIVSHISERAERLLHVLVPSSGIRDAGHLVHDFVGHVFVDDPVRARENSRHRFVDPLVDARGNLTDQIVAVAIHEAGRLGWCREVQRLQSSAWPPYRAPQRSARPTASDSVDLAVLERLRRGASAEVR